MRASSLRTTAVSGLVAGVLVLAGLVALHPGPFEVDRNVTTDLIAQRSPTSIVLVSDASDLASPLWVGVWTVLAAMIFALRDRGLLRAGALVAAVGAAGAVTGILKLVVDRPRPPAALHPGIAETSLSFPSGHVTGACALVMTTVVLIRGPRWLRTTAAAIGIVVTALAATTRLYLGVHWLSDVVAAAAVGTAAAVIVPPLIERIVDRSFVFLP